MNTRPYLTLPALLLFAATSAQAIQLGLLDDFEAGPMACTTDGWQEGGGSPNPPVGTLGCGELDSCCMEAASSGGFGPGSKQVVFNDAQWSGDYIAAGVNKIQMQAANSSISETLNMRIGVTNGSTCYVSTTSADLAPATPGPDGLQFISFFLDESTMTSVDGNLCGGSDTLNDVLSGVTQLRLISSAIPAWDGDAIVSTMQIDAMQSKADSDLDGINNDVDNCTLVANADQLDTDGDGFGNICDGDFNNDCAVNFVDLGELKTEFLMEGALDEDMDGNGSVNFVDLGLFKAAFLSEPGPGLGACGACTPPDALGSNSDFGGLPMFMRGGLVLDWGADVAVNGFSDQTGGLYVTRFEMNAGTFEWKIADEGWSIEYCSESTLTEGAPANAPLFGCAFPANGSIDVPTSGCYEFSLQTDGGVPPAAVDIEFTPFN